MNKDKSPMKVSHAWRPSPHLDVVATHENDVTCPIRLQMDMELQGGDFKSYFITYMYNITPKRIRQPSDVNPHIILFIILLCMYARFLRSFARR